MEVSVTLRTITALSILLCLGSVNALGQQSTADSPVDLALEPDGMPRELNGFEGEIHGLWRDGRVFIGGQPDEAALARFGELGVTVVINLRSVAEMSDRERVPFDEAEVVKALGMQYVHIPLGGEEHPYTPEAVDRLAGVLALHDGPVLLHCTVAWRASYMWSAYLIREHGFELDEAMVRAEAMAISDLPIEGLLGRQLELVYAD
jgi:uncharacterized protein (TIGR01244 family)